MRFYAKGDAEQPIKVSRGEETMFIWCFFLAIVQLAMDGAETYQWVKYIVIDDPISSLDEHNAIVVANHLGQFLARNDHAIKTVISTHHALFFNVLWNEISTIDSKKFQPWLLSRSRLTGDYALTYRRDTPFFIIWRCWKTFVTPVSQARFTRITSMRCEACWRRHRYSTGTKNFLYASSRMPRATPTPPCTGAW